MDPKENQKIEELNKKMLEIAELEKKKKIIEELSHGSDDERMSDDEEESGEDEEGGGDEFFDAEEPKSPHSPMFHSVKKQKPVFLVKDLDRGEVVSIIDVLSETNYTAIPRRPIAPTSNENEKTSTPLSTPKKKKEKNTQKNINDNDDDEDLPFPSKDHISVFYGNPKKKDFSPPPQKKAKNKRKNKKKSLDEPFSQLQHLQTLKCHEGSIWVLKFNNSGKYLATGGEDGFVNIYETNRSQFVHEDEKGKEENGKTMSSFINETPVMVFLHGKHGDVLDIGWSKRNFLITSTTDKIVRVFHLTKDVCLAEFEHKEFVPALCFHPKEDEIFVSACFDEKIQLFNLREKQLVCSLDTHKMLTSICFSKDGGFVMGGSYDGKCLLYDILYETKQIQMKYKAMIDVRSRRGKNKGKKVTGIVNHPMKNEIMVSTNDSRVRVYSLNDYSETQKFKGHSNKGNQIKATFSNDGKWIISGSENSCVYIWDTGLTEKRKKKRISKKCSCFKDNDVTVTNAVFAPFNAGKLQKDSFIITADYNGIVKVYRVWDIENNSFSQNQHKNK